MTKYLCLLLTLLLAGCASVSKPSAKPLPQQPQLSWAQRQQQLEQINHWNIKGAIAIHAPQNSGSASLTWQQNAQSYSISLLGPFGSNAVQITGKPGSVVLETSDGKSFHANSPEQLLHDQTGWQLPISNLFYWTRGLPTPNLTAQRKLDASQRLVSLTQDGWQIWFKEYGTFGGTELPTRIVITHPSLNIKLVIYQWGIG